MLELLGWGALSAKLKSDARRHALTFGPRRPRTIPIIDAQAKRLAGNPSKLEKAVSKRIVRAVRAIVNTQSFEHVVVALTNKRSKIRKSLSSSTMSRVRV